MADDGPAYPRSGDGDGTVPSGQVVGNDSPVRSAAEREIESVLQHRFTDITLLRGALRHPSAAKGDRDAAGRFQRMEFLGDRVLGLVIAAQLYHRFPSETEGELSLRFTQLVRTETLVEIAVSIGLARALIRNGGDRTTETVCWRTHAKRCWVRYIWMVGWIKPPLLSGANGICPNIARSRPARTPNQSYRNTHKG